MKRSQAHAFGSLKKPLIRGSLYSSCLGLALVLALGCSQEDGRKESSPALPSTTAGGGSGGSGSEEEPGTGVADALSFESLPNTALFTKSAAENTCVTVAVNTTLDGKISADVSVSFEIIATGPLAKDPGSLSPTSGRSDASGRLTSIYCSGDAEGGAIIVAKAGQISSNSAKISVEKKPSYQFTYVGSDADPELRSGDGTASSKDVIFLNLLDSGPQDCTQVYFKLTQSGTPVVGEKLTFRTQVDFPKGAKLGKRGDSLQTLVDGTTGKKYAMIEASSSGAGEFAIPVCAGVALGTLQISSTFVDPDDIAHPTQSPVIRITAGLTNYINMSLTFDNMNARTLKAYFNTNSSYQLPFNVQLGARYDGDPLTQYPLSIATEVGRVLIENGGTPSKDKGTVSVKLQSLHLVDQYPFPLQRYDGYPLAQTRCEPSSIAQWGASQSLSSINYSSLRSNWRSTMVYSIRGQEYYHDANRNGIYDVGGDGFWDKNQNGIYDTGDTLTYDAGGNGFDPLGEWFIDLPSPFVDVDEDGVFTSTKDILIGDEYQAPSGKRESDALLWKYEYFPISMGASAYGMQRYRISTSAYQTADSSLAVTGAGTYEIFGISSIDASDLWTGGVVTASAARYQSIIFAHDLCGSLLPGGTEFSVQFITSNAPAWGTRTPLAHYYMQPGDSYLEPARHLIKNGDSSSKAVINFNAVDHPAAAQSYPVLGSIEVPACINTCTGAVVAANPGVSCDGWAGIARLNVKEPKLDESGSTSSLSIDVPMSFNSYQACNCVATASHQSAGVCSCPANTEFDAATGICS